MGKGMRAGKVKKPSSGMNQASMQKQVQAMQAMQAQMEQEQMVQEGVPNEMPPM